MTSNESGGGEHPLLWLHHFSSLLLYALDQTTIRGHTQLHEVISKMRKKVCKEEENKGEHRKEDEALP